VSALSNGQYFLIVPLVSVTRVVSTSKGMSKKFGVRVIYRKIRYIKMCFWKKLYRILGESVIRRQVK
jgi:hypothetical protein